MCGIIGYTGAQPALARVIEGLRRLEYRGYDSAGVALATSPGIPLIVEKRAGKLSNLESVLTSDFTEAKSGIGHTRWATHGAPTEDNAHPHIVGDVTIELARLIDRAIAGQVILGDFKVPMPDEQTHKSIRVDAESFIERTQQTLSSLEGLVLSGEPVDAIKCYLTGSKSADGKYSITKYLVTDKHGLTRYAYNAKINIYRENAEPIFLGVQDHDIKLPSATTQKAKAGE